MEPNKLFNNCTLVKDISHDADLCHVSQIKFLSPRQIKNHAQHDEPLLPLGMAALRYLIDFPEHVPLIGEKIIFPGILIRNNSGSLLPYYPAIIVTEFKKERTVEMSYLLEISKSSEFYYSALM